MHSEHTPPVFLLSHFFPSMQHGGSWEADLHQITVKLWYASFTASPLFLCLFQRAKTLHTLCLLITGWSERMWFAPRDSRRDRVCVCTLRRMLRVRLLLLICCELLHSLYLSHSFFSRFLFAAMMAGFLLLLATDLAHTFAANDECVCAVGIT